MSSVESFNKKFLAINYGFPGSVVFSQLIEYTLRMRQYGIFFDYNFLLNGSEFLRSRNSISEKIEPLKSQSKGRVCVFPAPFANRNIVIKLYSRCLVLNNELYNRNKKTVLHPRGLTCGLIAYYMNCISENYSYVYDMRGDIIAEVEFHSAQKRRSCREIENDKHRFYEIEKKVIARAKHIICVSNVLKELALHRYNVNCDKISVIPCCADENHFFYDEKLRANYRSFVGLENRKVIVYSGGLDRWHCSEIIFDIIGKIINNNNKYYFIALTPNVEDGLLLASKYFSGGNYLIKNAQRDEVPKYLSASDFAIILRDDDPVNKSASPTKIAEYMLSGLPIIISDNIGDYSNFIDVNNIGLVISEFRRDSQMTANLILEYMQGNNVPSRYNISSIGRSNYSKSNFIDGLRDIYLLD